MKAIITALAASAALSGCATSSDQISGSYVPINTYIGMTCDQMHIEAAALSAKAHSLGVDQDSKAGSDVAMTAVSLILFWPAAFFISGNDETAGQLAEVKGRVDALGEAAKQQGCETLTPT